MKKFTLRTKGALLHPITHKYEGSHNKSTFRGNQFPLPPFVSFRGLFLASLTEQTAERAFRGVQGELALLGKAKTA